MQATLLPLTPSLSLYKSQSSLSSSLSSTFNPSFSSSYFPSLWKFPLVSSSSSKLISLTPLHSSNHLQTKTTTTTSAHSSSNSSSLFKALELGVFFCLSFFTFNIYNKQVLKVYRLPVTLTAVQFAIDTLRVALMWGFNLYKRPKLTNSQWLAMFPLALAHSLGNLFTNTSLGKVAVSFTHTVKSMEPFFYALLSSMFLGKLQSLMTREQQDPEASLEFQTHEGLLFFDGKLFIPASSQFKLLTLEEFHAEPNGGDNGTHKTYGRLKKTVFWYGMKKDVDKECLCQQGKSPNTVLYLFVVE